MLRNALLTLAATGMVWLAPQAVAQNPDCNGSGGAIFEIEAADGNVIGPGSTIVLRMTGEPFRHFCLMCDFGDGTTFIPIPGVGEICLPFSAGFSEVVGQFPATGILEFQLNLPNDPGLTSLQICCLFVDLDLTNPTGLNISNRLCMCPGFGCIDKIKELQLSTTMTYAGPFPVNVTAIANKDDDSGDPIGATTVSFDPNNPPALPITGDGVTIENLTLIGNQLTVLFRVDAQDFNNNNRLPSNTYVDVSAGSAGNSHEIHTSCSQPIGQGFVFGDFLITELVDPEKANECNSGDPAVLCMTYTGDDCTATSHGQDDDKVECAGDPMDAPTVHIRASNKDDPTDTGAKVWFEGPVNLGELFQLEAANAGEDSFSSATHVHIFDMPGGTLLQQIEFHTSCSQPLALGDQFGAIRLDCFISEDEIVGNDLCDLGDPAQLTLTYTGDDCSATSHAQDPGKVNCSGDPLGLPSVYIVSTDDEDPNDANPNVWFTGSVSIDTQFTLDATAAGEDKLKTRTFVYIYDTQGGTLLQSIEFHTSCSQPIQLGDQFGAVRVDGFVAN